jgi:BirA family biotin operon repressor/biotin-[acetyl-CoA-carboxylase] ligase
MTTTPDPAPCPLSIDALRRVCAAARFGRDIRYFESVASTNTVARQLAIDGAGEGTAVIAEAQSQGRGRLGRTWASPPYRNLYLSLILRPPLPIAAAPQVGLVAGLAVAETACEWAGAAAIKWPNDVLVRGRKAAGILTEMEAADGRVRFVVLGIGVNLNSLPEDFPPDLRDKAIGLCTAAGAPVDRARFTARLLLQLEQRYDFFLRQGFAVIRPLWEGFSCLTGRRVQIEGGEEPCTGVVSGLDGDGALRLRQPGGKETRVVAGNVTVIGGYESQPSAISSQLLKADS